MIKQKNHSFNKIYIIYLTLFISICTLFSVFIYFIDIIDLEIVKLVSIIFLLSIVIIGLSFIYIIKLKVQDTVNLLDNMISKAIDKEEIINRYDETILSSLEHKLLKYIKIYESNKKAIEKERNSIKSLVADISHQTKTPIANIMLYSELILENENLDEYTKDILLDINNQSNRLNFLIQSLIKMSRLENGIIKPTKNKTKLIDTISSSIKEVYKNADKKQISISVDGDKSAQGYYDNKWTIEAIVNILENAIKYTNENGSISININSYELFKRIDITDNGIGIEESEINNIFKRFYRCKNTNQYDGVGIGLYLTRQIISHQGGYIKVSSKINQGSTFSIFLPA
ncbi:Alkaline phosphatase synthesis sensor protein phoR [uncultured Clostridium sp.]|nr:Alkaline phosphatase synthesis sensor protein phoR [uncultured Clostridium sp.]SCJ28873.1 Alkaline phosphatase synthesis sensor protein phoR [uncultured Clostridium sp.]